MDYDHDIAVAFALAGTVAIPSPVPAVGRVSIGLRPVPPGYPIRVDSDGHPTDASCYLKVVEVVDASTIITRIFRLEDLRAARVHVEGTSPTDPACWPVRTRMEIEAEIKASRVKLTKDVEEILLFEKAVIYVPRSPQVLVRREMGMTAEESIDEGPCLGPRKGGHPAAGAGAAAAATASPATAAPAAAI